MTTISADDVDLIYIPAYDNQTMRYFWAGELMRHGHAKEDIQEALLKDTETPKDIIIFKDDRFFDTFQQLLQPYLRDGNAVYAPAWRWHSPDGTEGRFTMLEITGEDARRQTYDFLHGELWPKTQRNITLQERLEGTTFSPERVYTANDLPFDGQILMSIWDAATDMHEDASITTELTDEGVRLTVPNPTDMSIIDIASARQQLADVRELLQQFAGAEIDKIGKGRDFRFEL